MASSRERIIQACNGLQVPAISLDWADQAWISDFCEPVELPESYKTELWIANILLVINKM